MLELKKNPVDVILLDFSEAFDKVPHKGLLFKAQNHGIDGAVLEWIRNWFQQRSQRVVHIKILPSCQRSATRFGSWTTALPHLCQ